jgi:hypothetical protein
MCALTQNGFRKISAPVNVFQRLVAKPIFWIAIIGGLFALPLVRTFLRPPPKLPAVYGTVAPFSLARETGVAGTAPSMFGTAELRGKVWVAARFQADDKKPSARAMLDLERHMRKLGDAFWLVSIDAAAAPAAAADTPAAAQPPDLAAASRNFALNHRTNPRRWAFVSGAGASALLTSLKLDGAAGSSDSELVLVDSELRIRGFYDFGAATQSDKRSDRETLDQLMYDAALLVNHY